MYIPNWEMTVFIAAFVGSLIGFLWYNSYPASVLWVIRKSNHWGIIAVLAIAVRKELLIPLLCGVFLVENLSVVIQVSYFKYTKKTLWRRPKNLPDGAFASSLSKEGLP
jgi:phospho-N-acetylmuramoyl-pentapeptide-transferase